MDVRTSTITLFDTPNMHANVNGERHEIMEVYTPMLPLNTPWKHLESTRGTNVVEAPKISIENAKPSGAKSKTGLRPNRSDK